MDRGERVEAMLGSSKVAIVDDSDTQRRCNAELLREAGYSVQEFSSATKALPVLLSAPPALVILDMMMPGMNGNELLRIVRANVGAADTPVIMLTSASDSVFVDEALSAGADDYITRPVNPQVLLARVRSILQAHRDRKLAVSATRLQEQHAALQAELSEAHRFQRAMLPAVPETWPGFSVTGAVVPSGTAGGDLFDVVTVGPDRHVVLLLDVCGHGIASAVVGAEVRRELRTRLSSQSLSQALSSLNHQMARWGTDRFVSVGGVEIRGDTVAVVNAGLPNIVVQGATRRTVCGSGLPPGMFRGTEYLAEEVSLRRGDFVALVSDGLTEPFGAANDVDGALGRLGIHVPLGLNEFEWSDLQLEARLRAVLTAASPELRDDATLVLLEKTA